MSLCHGNIGNLLMMEQFAFCFREQELAMMHEFRKKVKGAWKRGGIIMEIEKRNWGLMGGCAGIGYGCLLMAQKCGVQGRVYWE